MIESHPPFEYLYDEYVVKKRTAHDVVAPYGISRSYASKYLRSRGIEIRPKAQAMRLAKSGVDLDEAEVVRLYRAGYSTNDLHKRFRSGKSTILATLRRHGVQLRSKSEANRRDTGKRRFPPPAQLMGARAECACCGSRSGLELHHVNGRRDDASPDNIITLCWEHHMLIERLIHKAIKGIRLAEIDAA